MDKVECVVIGAGVIGLAVARQLAQAGREVIVLEAAESIGTVTSSRNSEVIHAGIYYPAGSLMARMCVSGKQALYQYCGEHGIPHKNCGKLIVATTPGESEKLQSIRAHAEANGVLDMQTLSGEAARGLEPALNCDAALLSPSTGIIDSHAYMLALRGDAEEAGVAYAFHTPIERARAKAGRIEIEAGGLGVHLTLDMAGQARFGPDVEWVETIDYAVDPARADRFYPAIRRYWPTLPDGALMPSYSGIRPKIVPPAVAAQDFMIQGPRDHGVAGLINLFGIESPGLTSSLAIADHVGGLAER